MSEPSAAFATFERKWLDANPEQIAVQIFLDPAERRRSAAFGSLIHELSQTAFGVRETQAAAAKLGWWRQELSVIGTARHPIARELFADARAATVDAAHWRALIDGALAQLDASPPASIDASLSALADFFVPAASIEAAMFDAPQAEVPAIAALYSCSHLLVAAASDTFAATAPLDLLARHAATRDATAQSAALRGAVTRDFIASIRSFIADSLPSAPHASIATRVRGRTDLSIATKAAKHDDPHAYLLNRARRPGVATVWRAWQETRAARRRT